MLWRLMMKVVRISAIWCMSCLVMKKRYDEFFKSLDIDQVLDLDFDEDDIETYQVGNILPLVIFYQDQKEVLRIVGEKSKKELNQLSNQYLSVFKC